MTLPEDNPSNTEFCRMCYEVKNSFVNIFETLVFKEGCLLADKLNDLYGVEAAPDDEFSKFICIDCVRDIKLHGDITYGLWSTLDYLERMHEDKQVEMSSFYFPKESLDFLFSEKKECVSQSIALPNDCDSSRTPVMECSENKGMDCVKSEVEEPVDYCWCSECNAEFLNKGEMWIHMKTHENAVNENSLSEATDSVLSSEEYKLISGEFSLLRSGLCCSKCRKEFKSEKRLVKHIMKYDFKCKPRNFECLNSLLKTLKSITREDNTLLNIQTNYSSPPIDSKLCDNKGISVSDAFDSGSIDNTSFLLQGNVTRVDLNIFSHGKRTIYPFENFPVTKRTNISRLSNADVGGPHISLCASQKQNIGSRNNSFIEGDEYQKDVALLGKSTVVSTRDPDKHSTIMSDKPTFRKLTSVDGGIVICDYCNKSCILKSKLREHIVLCHLSIVIHKCVTCYNVFASESELRTHCAVHISNSKYICTLCNDNFSSKLKISSHLKEVHKLTKGCICCVCFLGFSSRLELSLHQLCHSSDKKYKCSKCGKAYLSKSYYMAHVRFCQLRRVSYQCKICEKNFLKRQDLETHSLIHSSEKHFSCRVCKKRFRQISHLNIHVRIVHLKLKPHECGICRKKFSLRNQLVCHYTVHSDDRPFPCELCGKTFKVKYRVRDHKKNVHGEI